MTDFARCVARGCILADDLARIEAQGMAAPLTPMALADYLREATGEGVPQICARLRADMSLALARGDDPHAARLLATLRHYLHDHPVAC